MFAFTYLIKLVKDRAFIKKLQRYKLAPVDRITTKGLLYPRLLRSTVLLPDEKRD